MVALFIVVWSRDGSPCRRSVLDVHGSHQANRGSMALIRQVNGVGEELDGFYFQGAGWGEDIGYLVPS